MEDKKRYRMTFRADKHKRKILYTSCAESEVQGEKERLAMFLESETGIPWRCANVAEVSADVYIGERGGGD